LKIEIRKWKRERKRDKEKSKSNAATQRNARRKHTEYAEIGTEKRIEGLLVWRTTGERLVRGKPESMGRGLCH
jgi:hypothetical protein